MTAPSVKLERPCEVRQSQRCSGWLQKLSEPNDTASLAVFRIAFGAVMFWEVCRFFWHGWIGYNYIGSPFHFTYEGFEWVAPWPGIGMYLHFAAVGIAALCVMLGLFYRLSITLLCIGLTYIFLLEKAEYLNHFYLVCLLSFLLAIVPADRAFSLDAWRAKTLQAEITPAWSLAILRFQIAIPYVYGGIAKLNGDWPQGQPMQIWLSRMGQMSLLVPALGDERLALLISCGGLIFDLGIVPLLIWKRTRPMAFMATVIFHLCNAWMFRIGIFPWLMICAATLFFEPDWPRKLFRLPQARQDSGRLKDVSSGVFESWRPTLWTAFLAIYVGLQLLIPLRHWLYPGKVDWTEEGGRFAWRMMLCDKPAAVQFIAIDPQTGSRNAVDPRKYLTPRQLEKMGENPEMLREFAAYLKRELARDGADDTRIQVIALCALNGRRPQLLIDPTIDLAAQPRSIWPAPWIVPLTEPLPDQPLLIPQREWGQYVPGAKPVPRTPPN